jgi:ribonuclease E
MAKRMLIDSTHPEETRVVVVSGNRLEEFDFETSTKRQIKGNIYLAKVTRVEPSLQAAFVDYGGNRHGFLAFSEIHPDYYRIPVGDRPPDRFYNPERGRGAERNFPPESDAHGGQSDEPSGASEDIASGSPPTEAARDVEPAAHDEDLALPAAATARIEMPALRDEPDDHIVPAPEPEDHLEAPSPFAEEAAPESTAEMPADAAAPASSEVAAPAAGPESAPEQPAEPIEVIGGDEMEEASRQRARRYRPYKIQEVVKRRQIMLVQVTKEERGNKGAALTTYLSLAGRYCVLMPNTDRGGGVSRKITSATDRKRLKEMMDELQVPDGMGIIVRTAGSERSKAEIKRDFEYLIRLWDEIRELTLKSTAPALIYEEGNLIKRSIRDLYTRDLEEVIVEGNEGYQAAKAFMRMLMPSHAKRVHHYADPTIPLFQRFQIESQIDAIHSPTVQLKSGGYIVINQAEALVAIDVNSGRATKERNIEETATKTNCEASDEIARQLRLRDLAGLIVVDFIDMEEHRNQVTVERRLKEAMKHDRARIQVGRISAFGLLEMSRQRLRPSIVEASTQPCPHCGGTGHIRSTESTALHVLRAIEEEGMRRRSAEIVVAVPTSVALYILNQKRATLADAERRYHFRVTITEDDTLIPPNLRLDRVRAFTPAELAALPAPVVQQAPTFADDEEDDIVEEDETFVDAESAQPEERAQEHESRPAGDEDGRGRRRRRRRRRRGGEDGRSAPGFAAEGGEQAFDEARAVSVEEIDAGEATIDAPLGEPVGEMEHGNGSENGGGNGSADGGQRKRRRRGRRGGKRRRRGGPNDGQSTAGEMAEGEAEAEGNEHGFEHAPEPEPWTTVREPETWSAASERHEAPEGVPEREAPPEPSHAVRAAPAAVETPASRPEPRQSDADNAPPPVTTTERPANPKRGWWHRLTQS